MPSRMIHYCNAIKVLRTAQLDPGLFIPGCLVPDAYPDGERRDQAHFRVPQLQRKNDCPDLDVFYSRYMNHGHDDFVAGYYCHLLADNMWLLDLYRKYGGQSAEERALRSRQCYRDYQLLNARLIKHFDLRQPSLVEPTVVSMSEVSEELLRSAVESLLRDFHTVADPDEPLSFLHFDQVLEFIDAAAGESLRTLNRVGR